MESLKPFQRLLFGAEDKYEAAIYSQSTPRYQAEGKLVPGKLENAMNCEREIKFGK